MKKIILGVILLLIVAVVSVTYYILTNLDVLVAVAIEKYGTQATHTRVEVSKVQIKLKEGSGAIHGLSVANPKGFGYDKAFKLGEIKLGIDYKSLKQQPYVINEITVRAPQVFFEVNADKKTNLNEIKNNLGVGGGKPAAKKETSEEKAKPEPKLIIRKILFTDGTIQARVVPLNNKEYKLKLPTLNMANLGGSKGATPTELAKEIVNRLIDEAKQQIKKQGIDAELDKLKAKAKAKIDAEKAKLQSQVDVEKAKTKAEADKKLEEQKQKAEDKLKGLFN